MGISWGDSKRKPRRLVGALTGGLVLAVLGSGTASAAVPTGPAIAVIIHRAAGAPAGAAERAVVSAQGRVGRDLGLIDSFAARVPAGTLGRLRAARGIGAVVPDGAVEMLASAYVPTTDFGSTYNAQLRSGVQDLHQAGLTGSGVTIALIDTGVVPVNGLRTPGKVIYGPDLSFESQAANLRNLDTYGHGTHMAGIMAGRDDAAVAPYSDPANFTGVAPDARILSLKIGDARGATDVSTMIAAIDWVVTHRNDNGMNVKVLNLSFGTDSSQYYLYDPIAHAVENAWSKGIVVVASAGNRGNGYAGLDDPARDPFVVSVGSVSYNSATASGKQLQVKGRCLGTQNFQLTDWTPVVLVNCDPYMSNQRWNLNADGSVTNVASAKCMDVSHAWTANGTAVILYTCNGGSNQKWTGTFAKTSQLRTQASGRCLDDKDWSTALGNPMIIWDCHSGDNQEFIFPLADDAISGFSSGGDGARNPDVVAPGQSIAGLRAPGSYVDRTYTSAVAGTRFFRGSGTSQAAAFVSGLVALQAQRRPTATPDDLKSELKRLTVPLSGVESRVQGSGALDSAKLLTFGTTSAPAQTFTRSQGYGSGNALQASRGSMALSMDNVVLAGEKDVFGKPFNAQAMAGARTSGSTWSGGTWNGSSWSGSSWSGSSWSGSSWSGSSWSSQSFSSNVWDGSRWTDSSWSGSTWSGSSWSGSAWSGSSWGSRTDCKQHGWTSNTIWG
ncbi:MAG: serine protease AprX [Frankiaceae bacterium]|nr:serine protease AprX [Frankiaceae bacterium]